jgi:putative flippase GtrA
VLERPSANWASWVPRFGTRHATRFMRFALVGCCNTLLSVAIYASLLQLASPYLLAASVSFAVGSINGYVMNRRWTFRAQDSHRSRLRYAVVLLAGLGANGVLVWLLVQAGVGQIVAYAVALPPVIVAMYATNRSWTFRDP